MRWPGILSISLASFLAVTGCAALDRSGDDPPAEEGTGGPGTPSKPGSGMNEVAHLTGKVVAPEGTIPISGALVYFAPGMPAPIPDGVFCDKCIHLPDGTPFTKTRADGSFDLTVAAGSAGYLVVQKGAFRRVRPITIKPGTQAAPLAMTTMPGMMDKANGDDIPKIAVVLGAWDPIEVVLARMGLKATITKDLLGKAQVLGKDAPSFAIYGVHGLFEMSPYPSPITLLTDPKEIGKYHIVFLPCSGSTNFGGGGGPVCEGVYNYDAKTKTTLDGFVRAGGRIYASDWSYEYVRQVFPGFVSWRGETSQVGSACMSGGGDQSVNKRDADLEAWLSAQGTNLSTVRDAWTGLTGVHTKADVNADNQPVMITPKVWVEASGAPVTTSFQHACGRVLYTTYHTQPTNETNGTLEPQALALLYLILEAAVCIDPQVIG